MYLVTICLSVYVSIHSVGGSLPIIFPYIAEFTLNKFRGPYLSVQSFSWSLGRLACGGLAWAMLPRGGGGVTLGHLGSSWRSFIAVSSLPALFGALLYFFLPESPRFLLEVRN